MKQDFNLKQTFASSLLYCSINQSKTLHPLINHQRASETTCFDQSGILKTIPVDVPAIEYGHNGECLGVRVDPASTNAIKDSGLLNISSTVLDEAWSIGSVSNCPVSNVLAPDGVSFSRVFNPNINSNSGIRYVSSARPIYNEYHTFSAFVKPNIAARAFLVIRKADESALAMATFDLTGEGRVISSSFINEVNNDARNVTHASIKPVGRGGWYRVSLGIMILKEGDTSAGIIVGFNSAATNISTYVWGMQLENNYSCTNYIPTNGSQVTRSQTAIGLFGGSFEKLVGSDSFTVITSFKSETELSINHVTLAPSIWTNDTNRIRCMGHKNPSLLGILISGRLNVPDTRNTYLTTNVDKNEWKKLKAFNVGITYERGVGIKAALMGVTAAQYAHGNEFLINSNTLMTLGGYRNNSTSVGYTGTGDPMVSGYLQKLFISKKSVDLKTLKAMTHQDIEGIDISKFNFLH